MGLRLVQDLKITARRRVRDPTVDAARLASGLPFQPSGTIVGPFGLAHLGRDDHLRACGDDPVDVPVAVPAISAASSIGNARGGSDQDRGADKATHGIEPNSAPLPQPSGVRLRSSERMSSVVQKKLKLSGVVRRLSGRFKLFAIYKRLLVGAVGIEPTTR